jgi:hypothetical protein
MRKTHYRRAAAAAALAASLAGPVQAAPDLYGTTYPGAKPLYLMNQSTGAAVAGPGTGIGGIADLASSGNTTSVWGVSQSSNTLYRFDVATGSVLDTVAITGTVAATGAPEGIVSLAWDNRDSVLYGSTAGTFGGLNNLYRINPGTGRNGAIRARYAELTALPLVDITGGTYTGVAATWARHELDPGVAFIVELGPTLSADEADLHARAVLAVAAEDN